MKDWMLFVCKLSDVIVYDGLWYVLMIRYLDRFYIKEVSIGIYLRYLSNFM